MSDSFGNVIMRATEDSNCCLRQCCDQLRPFRMGIVDRAEKTVITVRRPLRCNNCYCCPCLTQRLDVEWPPGADIGYVDQNLSVYSPSFDVFDPQDEKMFVIQGGGGTITTPAETCLKYRHLSFRAILAEEPLSQLLLRLSASQLAAPLRLHHQGHQLQDLGRHRRM